LEVANVLEKIFKERKPEKLEVDKGKELFYIREVQKLTTFYSTEHEEKSSVAERWNSTKKENMFKYFFFLRIPPGNISMCFRRTC